MTDTTSHLESHGGQHYLFPGGLRPARINITGMGRAECGKPYHDIGVGVRTCGFVAGHTGHHGGAWEQAYLRVGPGGWYSTDHPNQPGGNPGIEVRVEHSTVLGGAHTTLRTRQEVDDLIAALTHLRDTLWPAPNVEGH